MMPNCKLRNHIWNRFYVISCEGPVSMGQVIKNADVSVLRNFLAMFFSISRNFTKYYLHAKFQINWIIQTEITEGGGQNLPSLGHTNLQKARPV